MRSNSWRYRTSTAVVALLIFAACLVGVAWLGMLLSIGAVSRLSWQLAVWLLLAALAGAASDVLEKFTAQRWPALYIWHTWPFRRPVEALLVDEAA